MKKSRKEGAARNHGAKWTLDELRFLEEHYQTHTAGEIARKLRRTPGAVYSRAKMLKCNTPVPGWTEEEINTLMYCCENGMSVNEILAALPDRSRSAVLSRMTKMGIVRRRWLPKKLDTLKKYFASEGLKVAARLPGRSESAVRNQAASLGLVYIPGRRLPRWTERELSLLEQSRDRPLAELCKLFTRRSQSTRVDAPKRKTCMGMAR